MRKEQNLTLLFGVIWLAGMMAFSAWISVLSGRDTNWDLANYHYYNGYALWADRAEIDFVPAQMQTYFNPAIDLFTYLLIHYLKPIDYGIVMGALHGINLWILFVIAARILRFRRCIFRILCAAGLSVCGVFGVVFLAEIGTCFHDLIVSIFILGGIAMLLDRDQKRGEITRFKSALATSGCLFGFACGLKLTTSFYAVAASMGLLIISKDSFRDRIRMMLIWCSSALGGALLSYGFWGYSLWKRFRNPFFISFNQTFRSAYCEPVNFSDARFIPKSLIEFLQFPLSVMSWGQHFGEMPFRDYRPGALIVIGSVAVIVGIIRYASTKKSGEVSEGSSGESFLLLFTVIAYAVWVCVFAIYRYLAAIELLFPIVLFILVKKIVRHEGAAVLLSVLIVWGGLGHEDVPSWGRRDWTEHYTCVDISGIDPEIPSLIMMGSHQPFSYVIPSFPSSYEFVRLQSNFHDLDIINTELDNQIRSRIQQTEKRLMLMIPAGCDRQSDGILSNFGLCRNGSPVEIHNCIGFPTLHVYTIAPKDELVR